MSSIHETKHGSHELKWRENGHPKSKSFKTRGEAEARQREVDKRLREGKPVMRRKDAPTLRAQEQVQRARTAYWQWRSATAD